MDNFFDDWPLYSQAALVLFLLALSGFFSMAETSMISSNRHRLRAMANSGNTGAALAEKLLKRIDSLLSVLLISNNLINTILPILVTGIALHLFGESGLVLSIATLVVALLIIVFSEITPKVIGAAFPEKIASNVGWLILPLTFLFAPLLWLINNFVSGSSTISANTQSNLVTGITTTINGSGAITGYTGSAVITGIGTAFNNELGLGKTIYYSGNPIGSIASIQSATSLRLLAPIDLNLSNVAYTADGASTFFISEIMVGDTIAANVGPNLVVLGTVKSIESNVELILTANSTSNVANVAYAHTARDPYTVPGEGDKYLKYPQIGVIN